METAPIALGPIVLRLEGDLTLAAIEAVAAGARVALAPAAKAHLGAFRAAAEAEIAAKPDKRVYGLNTATGYGFARH